MEKIPTQFSRAIAAFQAYDAERIQFRKALHNVHDLSGELGQVLKTGSVNETSGLKTLFLAEEKKLHAQAHQFEEALSAYQSALKKASALVNRRKTITLAGQRYNFIKTRQSLELTRG